MNRAKHPRQARLRHARAPDPWAVQGGPASLRGRRGLFRVLARGSFLFGGEFSKTPTMISALSLPNFCLSPPKCPRFIQFSRFSYTKPQVMGLSESLDSFDIKGRFRGVISARILVRGSFEIRKPVGRAREALLTRWQPPLKRPFLSPVRLNRRRTCDFYASGTSPFRALATLRAAAVIVRSSTFTVTSAYFS